MIRTDVKKEARRIRRSKASSVPYDLLHAGRRHLLDDEMIEAASHLPVAYAPDGVPLELRAAVRSSRATMLSMIIADYDGCAEEECFESNPQALASLVREAAVAAAEGLLCVPEMLVCFGNVRCESDDGADSESCEHSRKRFTLSFGGDRMTRLNECSPDDALTAKTSGWHRLSAEMHRFDEAFSFSAPVWLADMGVHGGDGPDSATVHAAADAFSAELRAGALSMALHCRSDEAIADGSASAAKARDVRLVYAEAMRWLAEGRRDEGGDGVSAKALEEEYLSDARALSEIVFLYAEMRTRLVLDAACGYTLLGREWYMSLIDRFQDALSRKR